MDECLNDEQGNDGIYERDQTTRSGNGLRRFNVPYSRSCKAYVNGYDIDIVDQELLIFRNRDQLKELIIL